MRNFFTSRRSLLAMASTVFLGLLSHTASAQTYPDKPVRIVVGGPAGGAADVTARLLAEKCHPSWGNPFWSTTSRVQGACSAFRSCSNHREMVTP